MSSAIFLIPIFYGIALISVGVKIKKAKEKYRESVLDKLIADIWFFRLFGGRDESKKAEDRAGEYIFAGMLFMFGGLGFLLFFVLA